MVRVIACSRFLGAARAVISLITVSPAIFAAAIAQPGTVVQVSILLAQLWGDMVSSATTS